MLSTIILTILAAYQIVLAATGQQFACWDGECIDDTLKCNGVQNCEDGSDETFMACFNTTCDQEGYFRCNYGGCVKEALHCNGSPDCWDESDENKYLCADGEQLDVLLDGLRGDCSSSYAVKSDNKCLMWSQVCNGYKDCASGFDESAELCTGSLCPANSFRCENGACIPADGFCNHKIDCADGSDEMPYLCRKLGELNSKKCLNAAIFEATSISEASGLYDSEQVAVEEDSSQWRTQTCSLHASEGMLVKDYFTGFGFSSAFEIPDGSLVEVTCEEGYVHFGSSINRCVDSQWQFEGFGCVRICNQKEEIHNIRYTAHCTHDGNLVDCQSSSQIYGTELYITCAVGYKSVIDKTEPGRHKCNDQGSWHTEVANPDCRPICGIKSQHHPDITPWTVSIFKRSSSKQAIYDFSCTGTIISPYLVITAEACFSEMEFHNHTIVQGNHSISYNQTEDHGYILQNISAIQSIKINPSQKLILLKLSKPFRLGTTLKPICLDDIQIEQKAALEIETSGVFQKYQLGEGQAMYENNKYVLKHIVIGNETMYNINAFLMSINRSIQKSEIQSLTI